MLFILLEKFSAMNQPSVPASSNSIRRSGVSALGLSALGIVFGDIGTSPLRLCWA
jgi:K+ transporter